MSHFVAYILQFQEIIVYKIPPGGGGGSIAGLRSITVLLILIDKHQFSLSYITSKGTLIVLNKNVPRH